MQPSLLLANTGVMPSKISHRLEQQASPSSRRNIPRSWVKTTLTEEAALT